MSNMKQHPVEHTVVVLARMQAEQLAHSIAVSRGHEAPGNRCPLNEGEWAALFLTSEETVVIKQGGLNWVASPAVEVRVDVWGIIPGHSNLVQILRNERPFSDGEIEVLETPYIRHAQAYTALVAPFVTMGHDWLWPLGPVFAKCKRD